MMWLCVVGADYIMRSQEFRLFHADIFDHLMGYVYNVEFDVVVLYIKIRTCIN